MNIIILIQQRKIIIYLFFYSVIKINNSWIRFNDESVREIDLKEMKVDKQNHNKYVYNLFYEKK